MWYEEACGEFCELRGAHCERLPAFSIVAGFIRTTTRAPPEKSRSAGTPFSPKRLRSSNLTTTYAAALLGSISCHVSAAVALIVFGTLRLFARRHRAQPRLELAQMRLQLAATVLAYYASSVLTSCLTKELLTLLPRPLTIALLQQVVAAAVGAWDHRRRSGEPVLAYERHWHAALPASSALVVAMLAYRVSLLYNAVSFSQAVKTLQLLFSAVLARALLREALPPLRLLSLVLCLCGVGATSATEANFTPVGFALAVLSSAAQALQAVKSKQVLVRGDVGRTALFAICAFQAMLLLLPCWLVVDVAPLLFGGGGAGAAASAAANAAPGRLALLLAANALANGAAQRLSFAVLCAVSSPVSAAVINHAKRLVVIAGAVAWFGTPVSVVHGGGIATACGAMVLYQLATPAPSRRVLAAPPAPDVESGGRAASSPAAERLLGAKVT